LAHVFIIHFFIAHLRRHNFPMDRTMFVGSADYKAVRHEKPEWIQRLKENGELDGMLVDDAPSGLRIFHYLLGYAAVAFGLFLLFGALINTPYITW